MSKIAEIYSNDINDGPGFRVAVYWSFCDIHCPGCHNEKYWDGSLGKDYTPELREDILSKCSTHKGLSILGGEPFAERNIADVIDLAKSFKERWPDKTIWIWSGHTKEWLDSKTTEHSSYGLSIKELLSLCDTLVDGPFDNALRDLSLQFRGSRNQRIISLKSN